MTRGIEIKTPRTHLRKAAVSFCYEHGIFLKQEDMQKLEIAEGEAVVVEFPATGVYCFELCRDFEEIKLEQEAKMLLTLFEAICSNHYSFLGRYGITERLESKARPPITLAEVYPELNVKSNSPFTMLYRKVEDVLIELDFLSIDEKPGRSLRKKVDDSTRQLSRELQSFYETTDCVVGAGSYISGQPSKPLETSYGVGDLDIGITSHSSEGLKIGANPFVVYWIIDDHCKFGKRKINWNLTDLGIYPTQDVLEAPIEKITTKCYIPSQEITSVGASRDAIVKALEEKLSVLKPFILPSDFLLPFSSPSMVLELDVTPKVPYLETTPYGYIPEFGPSIPRISDLTKIDVEFFDYPRFNRKIPIILDTSAIDISRFPMSPHSGFYQAFIENREMIIPTVVMHELKTRIGTRDRLKVEKALLRFNKLRTWGFIKDIRIEGAFPELSLVDKELIEDLRDCMIIDVAKNNNAVIFSNDNELVRLAALMGIYPITFSGLEEDVTAVIRENNLKLTVESAVERIKEYGTEERGEEYGTNDILWMIEYLCQQDILKKQKIGKREVLQFIGVPRLRR